MESQNECVDKNSAFVCGSFIFPMDAINNQQLQSVQYGFTDENNPRPTCQKDNSARDFMLQLKDNDKTQDLHTQTIETIIHYYRVVPFDKLVSQQDDLKFGLVFIIFPSISSENDTENDELLGLHSALEFDKLNINAKLETGMYY